MVEKVFPRKVLKAEEHRLREHHRLPKVERISLPRLRMEVAILMIHPTMMLKIKIRMVPSAIWKNINTIWLIPTKSQLNQQIIATKMRI